MGLFSTRVPQTSLHTLIGLPIKKPIGKPGRATNLTIPMIISGRSMYESTGATLGLSWRSPHLSAAYAELGQFDDAWRCVNEAMTAVEATKETWCEAESHRVAGEIALKSPVANAPNAQAHFERALAVARAQQAKSWELRAAMSMARLLRDQGKRDEARAMLTTWRSVAAHRLPESSAVRP